MSKDKHTTPGEFPVDECRTKDVSIALTNIHHLIESKKQFAVSYLGDEIVINYTTGPYKR